MLAAFRGVQRGAHRRQLFCAPLSDCVFLPRSIGGRSLFPVLLIRFHKLCGGCLRGPALCVDLGEAHLQEEHRQISHAAQPVVRATAADPWDVHEHAHKRWVSL